MAKTYYIDSFEQLIEVGTTFGFNWFRGQSKPYGNLTPSIFRPEYTNEIREFFRPRTEFEMAEEFKRRASAFSDKLPESNNNIEWLFLMQHHGVPTRLLDWSESILVAAYFALYQDEKDDGEIWSMLPWELNKISGISGYPIVDKSKIVKFLSNEIFHNNSEELLFEYKLKEIPKSPIAIQPPMKHARYTAQSSCFTLHPKPIEGNLIPDVLTNDNFLVRYLIPKKYKYNFLSKLHFLGITHDKLFPDLDSLAKAIVSKENTIAWGQPSHMNYREYLD